ncbi:MAG: calcium/proton exchanger [Ktedonobacteraceae bacterium]
MPRWLYFFLIFAVLAPILDLLHVPPLILFIIAALGIVPLAALIGVSVEQVAEHTGERIGGLLFATFGNATELIIGILALSQGLVDVVRASIIGTILGNALLVLGVSVCVGGFKYGRLKFEVRPASQYASLFALCIGGLVLPTVAELLAARSHQALIVERGELLSDFIAVFLLLGYIASILFSVFHIGDNGGDEGVDPVLGARSEVAIARLLAFRHAVATSVVANKSGILQQIDGTVDTIKSTDTSKVEEARTEQKKEKKTPLWRGLLFLALATIGVAVLSEILVGAIEPVTVVLHLNPAFVGLVFIPLIGGLPEYFNTITMALDKRVGMVLAASAGSSIQIALLMAPVLVLISLFTPKRLDLVFSIVELAVLGITTFLFSEITKDGELVWLEGLLLILLYAMMGATVFLFG